MKLKLKIRDEQTRLVWDAALRAQTEVEKWPAWKRGEDVISSTKSSGSTNASSKTKTTDCCKRRTEMENTTKEHIEFLYRIKTALASVRGRLRVTTLAYTEVAEIITEISKEIDRLAKVN